MSAYTCAFCAHGSDAQLSPCPNCGRYMTMIETAREDLVDAGITPRPGRVLRGAPDRAPVLLVGAGTPARPLSEISETDEKKIPTGVPGLDKILGGGLVDGQFVLLSGDPGAGKSTLLLQALVGLLDQPAITRVLYATAEERCSAIAARAHRIYAELPVQLHAMTDADLERILAAARELGVQVLVVDSMQAVVMPELGGDAGGVTQVRACGAALTRFAKETGTIVIAIVQVDKDGTMAGPRALEHMVDTRLELECEDPDEPPRRLRKGKDRMSAPVRPVQLVMTKDGLQEHVEP